MATTGDYPPANGTPSSPSDASPVKVLTTVERADEVNSAPVYPTNPKHPNDSTARIQDDHRPGQVISIESHGSQGTYSMQVDGRSWNSENLDRPPTDWSNDSNYARWPGYQFVQSPCYSDQGVYRTGHGDSVSAGPPTSPVKGSTRLPDPESTHHKAVLEKRGRLSKTRNIVVAVSVVLGLLAFIAMVAVLGRSRSKKMARASFTGGITVIWLSIAAGMAAADRGMVEVLIMMNIVIVYGIFLSGQIDVLMS